MRKEEKEGDMDTKEVEGKRHQYVVCGHTKYL